jgi:hypothetical protein
VKLLNNTHYQYRTIHPTPPTRQVVQAVVTGRLKTGHSWALQNRPL